MPAGQHGGSTRALQSRLEELEQLVQRLSGGGGKGGTGTSGGADSSRAARGGKGGGGKGTGKGGGLRSNGGGGSRWRPGDWECSECGAAPCFARALSCFRCRAPRSPLPQRTGATAERGGGGGIARTVQRSTYLGPVGADGSRPLLGRRGGDGDVPSATTTTAAAAASCPSFRVRGASVAARAEESAAAADGDSWATVVRGAASRPPKPPAAAPAQQGRGGAPTSVANSWAELAEDDDIDVDEGDGADDAEGPPGGGGGEEVQAEAPNAVPLDASGGQRDADADEDADGANHDELDADDLKREWISLCGAVRLLERNGQQVPPRLLASAREQRDTAERRWRSAKRPHPLHKRLRWAEADLHEAEAKERARREELAAHLAQSAQRTADIEARLEVDVARTRRKREALQSLYGKDCLQACPITEQAARTAATGINADIAPTLLAAIGRLGDDAGDVRGELQQVAMALGKVEGILRDAASQSRASRAATPAQFDISDGADGGGRSGGGGGDPQGHANAARPQPPQEARQPAACQRWTRAEAVGQWKRAPSSLDAVEAARRIVQRQSLGQSASDAAGAAAAAGAEGHGAGAGGGAAAAADEDPATTNDLGLAERRRQQAAKAQFIEAMRQQQRRHDDPLARQQEDLLREERRARQEEELKKHQEAAQKAAEAAAAEEARQRAELVAKMSPEQLALAAQVHAQQAAVAAHAFGTAAASQMAGLVHQTHARSLAVDPATGQVDETEAARLVEMSPEQLAEEATVG